MSILKSFLKKIWFKYRKIEFGELGQNVLIPMFKSSFIYPQKIKIGDNVSIGPHIELHGEGGIVIGKGSIFAPKVTIFTGTHNYDSPDLGSLPFDDKIIIAQVIIGEYVWVGYGSVILPGVRIGTAAIIGAGSVVSKDVPDYAVVAGNPATIIKYRNSKVVDQLLQDDDPFVFSKKGHKKQYILKKNQ